MNPHYGSGASKCRQYPLQCTLIIIYDIIVSSIYISKLEDLLLEYDKSKIRYDFYLTLAYEDARGREKRVTEEEIKLAARNSLRKEGLRDPDTVRWDLKILLGSD